MAKVMARDWGFYHTATTNLERVKAEMANVAAFSVEQRTTIGDKVDRVVQTLEAEPKSRKWKRALCAAAMGSLLIVSGCSVDPDLLLQAATQFFTEAAIFVTENALIALR